MESLEPILLERPAARVLVLGCGLSGLSTAIYNAGTVNIVNVDFSNVAIDMMREKEMDREGMRCALFFKWLAMLQAFSGRSSSN